MSSLNQGSKEIVLPITIDEYFRSYRFDELKKYLDITEKYLEKAKSDFETSANEQAKKLSTANPNLRADEINDILSDEYWRYSERFPRILRNSFLVSAISLLEYEINIICESLKKKQDIRINLNDLRGNTLEQAKLYFKLARLNLTFNDKTWQEINNYYLIRNCIVHNNGLIKGSRYEAKLHAYATRNKITDKLLVFPEVRPHDQIALTDQFCRQVVETIQFFLVELEKNINRKSK